MESLDVFTTDITKGLEDIGGGILTGLSSLADQLSTISDSLGELGIMQLLSWIRDDIRTGFDNVYVVLKNTYDLFYGYIDTWVVSLEATIESAVYDLFLPRDQQAYKDRFTGLQNTLEERLPIIQKLRDAINSVISTLRNSSSVAPEFNLSFAEDYHGVWGTLQTIDLSWYEPYRETVKKYMTAFLWMFAIIRWCKAVPRALGGVSYGD